MVRLVSYMGCVLKTGHDWGRWDPRRHENLLGLSYRVRWCRHCGKQDVAAWY